MTLYDQIRANKRKSLLLIFLVLFLVIAAVGLYSYTFRGDLILPIIAAAIAIPSSLLGYYKGDVIALSSNHAKPLKKEQFPDIHNLVTNLAITSGLPAPKIYIINSPALNAFATGRNPEHASIALTSGLIERLDRSELEAVLAHELSHVRNYDILFSTLVAIFVGFLVILSDLFWRMTFFGGGHSRQNRNNNRLGAILAIVGIILVVLSPLIAKLIQLAISRQREYLADSASVLLTRYPEGLISALKKISASPPLETAGRATAHLYIANPLRGTSISKLFATHPPVQERIKRLQST